MINKITAIMLSIFILCAGSLTAFAAEVGDVSTGAEVSNSSTGAEVTYSTGADSKIYFNAAGWKNFKNVYCHIWDTAKGSFYGWQLGGELCERVSGTTYSYDLNKLNSSDANFEGGMKKDGQYCVIFSSDNGAETYALTIGTECAGDTAYMNMDVSYENAMDSEKSSTEALWENNNKKFGPHFTITSTGNISGTHLCPGENKLHVVGDWILTYYLSDYVPDKVASLKKAYGMLGIYTEAQAEEIFNYVKSKDGSDAEDLDMIHQYLLEAAPKDNEPTEPPSVIEPDPPADDSPSITDNPDNTDNNGGAGTNGGYNSGSSPDGQEGTIFVILASVMIIAAVVGFIARKRHED